MVGCPAGEQNFRHPGSGCRKQREQHKFQTTEDASTGPPLT
jgi:hypothetical protein